MWIRTECGIIRNVDEIEINKFYYEPPYGVSYLIVKAGNNLIDVWENMDKTDFSDLRRAAGFGARLLINPIGLKAIPFGGEGHIPTTAFIFVFSATFCIIKPPIDWPIKISSSDTRAITFST